ncbi:superinfection exclusion B family protein [Corallincola platygyrae]|uniref:Superinfection exclusion B family protein n=1 Tax=Corallincola platygyrae TaxID=1193278 RepID=A0ABW4XLA8_9GAMM
MSQSNWNQFLQPRKLLIWVWAASALMLFSPDRIIQRFGLSQVVQEIAPLLGILFFLISAIFLCETASEVLNVWLNRKRQKIVKAGIDDKIAMLDHQERAILREFFIQRLSTINLPDREPAVRALLENHVLVRNPDENEKPDDVYKGFAIHQWARPKLTSRVLQLPVGDMTEEQIRYLKQTRPAFVIKDIRLRRRRMAA